MANTKTTTAGTTVAAQAFVDLCLGVLPVWARQLQSSREQSEVAVTQMMQAFSDIGPHINLAESQSQKITEALNQADGGATGLVHACERTLQPLMADDHVTPQTRQALQQVLDMVRDAVSALQVIAEPINRETKQVAEHVDRMYEGFQYQDRISQMMALLEADMARLQQVAAGSEALPQLQGWLTRLESQYAMSEQRQTHSGGDGKGADDSKETTFF
jgi:DNA repair ATPase RecN